MCVTADPENRYCHAGLAVLPPVSLGDGRNGFLLRHSHLQGVVGLVAFTPVGMMAPVELASVRRTPLEEAPLFGLRGAGLIVGRRILFSGEQPVEREIKVRTKLDKLLYFRHGPAGFPQGNGGLRNPAQLAQPGLAKFVSPSQLNQSGTHIPLANAKQKTLTNESATKFSNIKHIAKLKLDLSIMSTIALQYLLRNIASGNCCHAVHHGYRWGHVLLQREGFKDNHKCVYRLYREEGLSLRLKRPKRNNWHACVSPNTLLRQ